MYILGDGHHPHILCQADSREPSYSEEDLIFIDNAYYTKVAIASGRGFKYPRTVLSFQHGEETTSPKDLHPVSVKAMYTSIIHQCLGGGWSRTQRRGWHMAEAVPYAGHSSRTSMRHLEFASCWQAQRCFGVTSLVTSCYGGAAGKKQLIKAEPAL